MWESVKGWTVDFFAAGWLMLVDGFAYVVGALMALVLGAVSGIFDALDVSMITSAMGNVPAQMLNVALQVGVGEATGIIIVALGIRFVLQLIPFVRLGS